MLYSLVIFDLDGTLLDTLEDLADSVNYALEQAAYPSRTLAEVRGFVGNGVGKLLQRALPAGCGPEQTQLALGAFSSHYQAHCADKTRPYPGVLPLLRQLRQGGCRVAIVSNKSDGAVQSLCRRYFPGLYDLALGHLPGQALKPSPEGVERVLETMQARRGDAVYVGDSEVDLATARNAELDCISVSWGFRSPALLQAQGARTIVSDPQSIADIILGQPGS